MFRWIANLFTTPDYVTVAELVEQADEALHLTTRAMVNHICNGGDFKDEAMVQLEAHRSLLKSQLDVLVPSL